MELFERVKKWMVQSNAEWSFNPEINPYLSKLNHIGYTREGNNTMALKHCDLSISGLDVGDFKLT